LRLNTERPVTITHGSNVLVGVDPEKIKAAAQEALSQTRTQDKKVPPLWDGRAAGRICDELLAFDL
jgi:UDP-N-acetylglucosamine 2-epimerase (non-hydrolysing)